MYKSDESGSVQERKEHLAHLAASLQEAKISGGATLLVGAGISISAGIPSAQVLIEKAVEKYPNFFTPEEKDNPADMQYNHAMQKLSNVHRKELFKPYIASAKLNFAHIAIAELLKQGFISRILTVNFDPLLIHACYMVGMYPFPAIYDLGAVSSLNAELLNNPCIVYLNGQHVGFVQRNTPDQFETHVDVLNQIVRSTGCTNTWIVAGYSGENDPLMTALANLRPYNNWLYWLEYSEQLCQSAEGKTKDTHEFLEQDEECKVIYGCDADETFMEVADLLGCSLDFIERPEKELKRYLEEINFNSTLKKKDIFIEKIKYYINILKSPDNVKKFNQSDEIKSLLKLVYEFEDTKPEKNKENLDYVLSIFDRILSINPNSQVTLERKFNTYLYYISNNTELGTKENSNALITLGLQKVRREQHIFEYFDLAFAYGVLKRWEMFDKVLSIIEKKFSKEIILEFSEEYIFHSFINLHRIQVWLSSLGKK